MTPVEQASEQVTIAGTSITVSRQATRAAVGALDRYLRNTQAQMVSWATQGLLDECDAVQRVCEQQVALRDDLAKGVAAIIAMLSEPLTEDSVSPQ